MKRTIAAALLLAASLPFPAVAQWMSPAASQSYNSYSQQRWQQQDVDRRIRQLESQQRLQQGFYQTRYQCGSSFYQCR